MKKEYMSIEVNDLISSNSLIPVSIYYEKTSYHSYISVNPINQEIAVQHGTKSK
jgi:hypothetical protein